MKKTLFGLFFLMVLTASLHAQREAPMVMDYVYMKDGSILIGKVTFDTEQYTLTLEDGQQLQLEKSEVKKIIQKVVGDNRSNSLSLENKRKFGLVHQFGLTVITPSSQATYNNFYFTDYSSGGFQLDYALHKYINQYFSAGIKLGIQKAFILDQNELKINVPVAVSMTNYFFTGFPSFFIDKQLHCLQFGINASIYDGFDDETAIIDEEDESVTYLFYNKPTLYILGQVGIGISF